MSKTYTYCGVSFFNGTTKMRFSNDLARVKVLAKGGHTNIMMIELTEPRTKLDAALFVQDLPEFQDADAQDAIAYIVNKFGGSTTSDPVKLREGIATIERTEDYA